MPRAIVVLMKPQQLISAGFAITAFAAASLPAVGWTLLGEFIERPTVSVQAPWSDAEPFFMAEAALVRVAMQQPETPAEKTAPARTAALW